MKNNQEKKVDILQERQELIQDVIDRLLSNPEYKAALNKLNEDYPVLKDYNRRLVNQNKFALKEN